MINFANALQSAVDAALPRLRHISEQQASQDRGTGKWVIKEILGHLIDSAANNEQRFVRARDTDPVVLPDYDQNAWVAAHGYRVRPWLEIVDTWTAYNSQLASIISGMPASRRAVECRIGGNSPMTLEALMRDYVAHLEHHLGQILRVVESTNKSTDASKRRED